MLCAVLQKKKKERKPEPWLRTASYGTETQPKRPERTPNVFKTKLVMQDASLEVLQSDRQPQQSPDAEISQIIEKH